MAMAPPCRNVLHAVHGGRLVAACTIRLHVSWKIKLENQGGSFDRVSGSVGLRHTQATSITMLCHNDGTVCLVEMALLSN